MIVEPYQDLFGSWLRDLRVIIDAGDHLFEVTEVVGWHLIPEPRSESQTILENQRLYLKIITDIEPRRPNLCTAWNFIRDNGAVDIYVNGINLYNIFSMVLMDMNTVRNIVHNEPIFINAECICENMIEKKEE